MSRAPTPEFRGPSSIGPQVGAWNWPRTPFRRRGRHTNIRTESGTGIRPVTVDDADGTAWEDGRLLRVSGMNRLTNRQGCGKCVTSSISPISRVSLRIGCLCGDIIHPSHIQRIPGSDRIAHRLAAIIGIREGRMVHISIHSMELFSSFYLKISKIGRPDAQFCQTNRKF